MRLETLYAYVSRGLLQSEKEEGRACAPGATGKADVLALRRRGEVKRQPAKALEEALGRALDWGGPLLESAITAIAGGRLYLPRPRRRTPGPRSRRSRRWWPWSGASPSEELAALFAAGWPPELAAWRRQLEGLPPLEAAQALLPILAGHDPAGFDLRPAATLKTGARLLAFLFWVGRRRRRRTPRAPRPARWRPLAQGLGGGAGSRAGCSKRR